MDDSLRRNHGVSMSRFDFNSPFTYQRCISIDDEYHQLNGETNSNKQQSSLTQTIAYNALVTLSGLFLLATFPITAFFSLKKIDSLQRCLVYRLGKRLPIKGPGLILTLPFIDNASIVDLKDVHFNIIMDGQQELTSDGSIISMFNCKATLLVTNAWLTTLKTNGVDHLNWLRIRFANMLRSTDIEDLEYKFDYIIKLFEENCNQMLTHWGYTVKVNEIPKFTIIKRADRISPIQKKIQQLLNLNDDEDGQSSSKMMDNHNNFIETLKDVVEQCCQPTIKSYPETNVVQLDRIDLPNVIDQVKRIMFTFLNNKLSNFTHLFNDELHLMLVVDNQSNTNQKYIEYFKYNVESLTQCPSSSIIDCKLYFHNFNDLYAFSQTDEQSPNLNLVKIILGDHIPMKEIIYDMIVKK